ncbi:MAG: hypothetical protein GY772_10260 [bacterium]|nr:hypothetical protein [bacterium]
MSDSGRVKRQTIGAPATVSSRSSAQFKMTENMGVFWPQSLYEKVKERKAHPDKLCKARRGKEVLVGVILDEAEHGFPLGAIRLEQVHVEAAEKSVNLLDEAIEEPYRVGHSQDIFDSASQKVCAMQVARKKDDAGGPEQTMTLKAAAKQKWKDESSSSDCDFLGQMAGPSIGVSMWKRAKKGGAGAGFGHGDGGDEGSKARPAKRKATTASSRAPLPEGTAASAAAHTKKSTKKQKQSKELTRQIKEINAADLVVKEVRQGLDMATTSRTMKMISTAALEACLRKVKAKITDAAVEVMCSKDTSLSSGSDNDDGKAAADSWSDKGMAVVQTLCFRPGSGPARLRARAAQRIVFFWVVGSGCGLWLWAWPRHPGSARAASTTAA